MPVATTVHPTRCSYCPWLSMRPTVRPPAGDTRARAARTDARPAPFPGGAAPEPRLPALLPAARPCTAPRPVDYRAAAFSPSVAARTTSGLLVMMPSTPYPAARRAPTASSTVQVKISSGLPCGPVKAWTADT
ncbi:hypothetical protein SFUMM280S_09062 [Streptomyces fumanus]